MILAPKGQCPLTCPLAPFKFAIRNGSFTSTPAAALRKERAVREAMTVRFSPPSFLVP